MSDTTHTGGGVTFRSGQTFIVGDVVGHDKIVQAPDPLAQYFHQLPPAPGDFVGREAEQRDLLNMIERGAVITGLRGMGGIGKTALGLVVAHRLKERYPDAQFFLDLRGAGDNPVTPLDALTHVVRAFFPTSKLPDNLEDMQALYLSVLQGKRALVFFDNAKDAPQVMSLLPPASCLLLITSREHFTLPGLKARDLNVLPPDKARELLISIAERLENVIAPSAPPPHSGGQGASREAAKQSTAPNEIAAPPAATRNDTVLVADLIAQLCGYLPQALRASASLLADEIDRDPIDYVQQLRDERSRLQRIGLDPARNLDMEATLNLSYAALTADEQRVFARLSVFPADFDAEAEEVICEDHDHTHLSRFVKLSLVQYVTPTPALPRSQTAANRGGSDLPSPVGVVPDGGGAGGGGRYSLHDLVRLFAAARLNDDERTAVQRRHAEHYKNVLSTADDLYLLGNEGIAQGLALFDREWTNIQAGQLWATANAEGDDEAAIICSDYPHSGIYILSLRQHARDRIRWTEQALAAARRMNDRVDEGVHLGNLGVAYADLGETRQAIEFYEQALVIMREIGDRRAEGSIVGNLGAAYADLGETRRAIEFYEQTLIIHREIGDRRGEGAGLSNLGLAYAALGETRKAIEFYEQRLVIAREIGDRRGEGNALGNLGNAYSELGQRQQAIDYYNKALAIARDIGDRRGESTHLWNMADEYDKLGQRQQAIAHAEAALRIFEAIEDPWAEKVRRKLAEWRSNQKKKWWHLWK